MLRLFSLTSTSLRLDVLPLSHSRESPGAAKCPWAWLLGWAGAGLVHVGSRSWCADWPSGVCHCSQTNACSSGSFQQAKKLHTTLPYEGSCTKRSDAHVSGVCLWVLGSMGAPSSLAFLTAQPCIQAVSQITYGMQTAALDTSILCTWLRVCLSTDLTGNVASSLLAEQIWRYFSVHFEFLLNQHLCDPQLGVLKIRTSWAGLHCSWREVWDLPCACWLAGRQPGWGDLAAHQTTRGQSLPSTDAMNASAEIKQSGFQVWSCFWAEAFKVYASGSGRWTSVWSGECFPVMPLAKHIWCLKREQFSSESNAETLLRGQSLLLEGQGRVEDSDNAPCQGKDLSTAHM